MLLALVVISCAGLVAVPASWAVRKQLQAERGEATPEAAARVWLLKLSAGEEVGLSRVLAGARHDELRQQWRDYRAEMTGTGREPSKLESVGPSAIEHQGADRASVTDQVRAVWWNDAQILAGTAHPWRWELRKDRGGWRVWSVELPAWCGVHVRANLCP
ncbi:hypothetical protein O7600_16540 [Micromonospora sp. WMMA1998]|uniref:hypothetical protein n=1 Tax=Micromonospora sp. WMMA1998 TaxID=3015167 RepID=UPI00248AFB7B|nr:hypothetical protein [Micromonospora sp. WMMA1998]WBC12792.1 hypothetical protein O7600_16540 [Micromonospora sp. WMMA1998]